MLEQSFQRWIGKICLRLGLVSGPGAQAPGQINRARGPEATSYKPQAASALKKTQS
jgi:hypothetical protein